MTESARHVIVIAIAVIVIAIGGAVAVVAAWLKLCEHELILVALGIVGAGTTIIAGEFGLSRSGTAAMRFDHPPTINQQDQRGQS